MSLSVRTRFEVLKRDRFTCSYCGKHPPEVLLEVDHIHPVAAGGTDDISNLTTACTNCNRGKSARLLDEGTGPSVNRAALAEMQERIEQAKAYMELLGAWQSIADQQRWRVIEAWARAYGAELIEAGEGMVTYSFGSYGEWPNDVSIRRFIKKLGLEKVLEAVEITASRFQNPGTNAVRYFYGVCHGMIRQGNEPSDAFLGDDGAAQRERERIGEILLHHQSYGYDTLEDAVVALWPSDR